MMDMMDTTAPPRPTLSREIEGEEMRNVFLRGGDSSRGGEPVVCQKLLGHVVARS